MKLKLTAALAGVMAAGALTATTGASAAIVCNGAGDCWHTHDRVIAYGPGYVRHSDDWYFHRTWSGDPHYRWHEYHDGRGFWRDGVWVPR